MDELGNCLIFLNLSCKPESILQMCQKIMDVPTTHL